MQLRRCETPVKMGASPGVDVKRALTTVWIVVGLCLGGVACEPPEEVSTEEQLAVFLEALPTDDDLAIPDSALDDEQLDTLEGGLRTWRAGAEDADGVAPYFKFIAFTVSDLNNHSKFLREVLPWITSNAEPNIIDEGEGVYWRVALPGPEDESLPPRETLLIARRVGERYVDYQVYWRYTYDDDDGAWRLVVTGDFVRDPESTERMGSMLVDLDNDRKSATRGQFTLAWRKTDDQLDVSIQAFETKLSGQKNNAPYTGLFEYTRTRGDDGQGHARLVFQTPRGPDGLAGDDPPPVGHFSGFLSPLVRVLARWVTDGTKKGAGRVDAFIPKQKFTPPPKLRGTLHAQCWDGDQRQITYDQTFEKLWLDNEPKPVDAGFGHEEDCPYEMVPVPGQPKWNEAPKMAAVSILDGFGDLVMGRIQPDPPQRSPSEP